MIGYSVKAVGEAVHRRPLARPTPLFVSCVMCTLALLLTPPTSAADTADLHAMAGDATGAVTAGSEGKVLFASGGHATFLPSQSPALDVVLRGCAHEEGLVYVIVGDEGTLLKSSGFQGAAFVQLTSGTSADLYGVAVFSGRIVAVGAEGTILRSSNLLGEGWTFVDTPTSVRLRGAASNVTVGIAVGDDGTIIKGNASGGAWSVVPGVPADGATLHGVATLTDSRFIAVGTGGTVLRGLASGLSWTAMAFPDETDLHGVAVKPGASQVIVAVGAGGAIYKSTNAGETWSAVESGVALDLHAVAYTDVDFLIAGDHGTMLRSLDGTLWSDQTPAPRTSMGRLRNRFR